MPHVLVPNMEPFIPIFPTPEALRLAVNTWSGMVADVHFRNEIWRISRSLKRLALPLLRASTAEQLDLALTECLPKYVALKFGLAKLIMLELSREGAWSPDRFLEQYRQACAESIQTIREGARSRLDSDRAEKLVSATEGLVLFSQSLLSAGIGGKVRDEHTVVLCVDPFIKADFLLFAAFLVMNGEISRFEKAALQLVAERANEYISEIEDIILSRNFDFLEQEETTPLEEYMARKPCNVLPGRAKQERRERSEWFGSAHTPAHHGEAS